MFGGMRVLFSWMVIEVGRGGVGGLAQHIGLLGIFNINYFEDDLFCVIAKFENSHVRVREGEKGLSQISRNLTERGGEGKNSHVRTPPNSNFI